MNVEWLWAADQLIFIIPFALAALYLVVYAVSGLTFGPDDFDSDADADVDADADADADADDEVDVPAVAGVLGSAEPSLAIAALSWLGVGKAPFSILLAVLFITWGVVGLCVNRALAPVKALHGFGWFFAVPAAFVCSVTATRLSSRLLGRYLPTMETYVQAKAALVGRTGTALLPITDKFGMAFVRDANGDGHQTSCRIYPDAAPIEKGRRVLLVDYKPEQGCYLVMLSDAEI